MHVRVSVHVRVCLRRARRIYFVQDSSAVGEGGWKFF